MSKRSDTTINERAQHLLKVVVERYIRDGQPIGSKILAEETGLGLSSATIRNVLSDLEERGYLLAPHTSAGRIPTDKGYRFFVDSLLTVKPFDETTLQQVKQQLLPETTTQGLIANASNMLSELTQLAGLVMLPKREKLLLRHVEFLPLSDKRVLVILVLNEHEVQNRIINTNRVYSESELQQAANYLNAMYAGQDIKAVRKKLLDALKKERKLVDRLMQATIEVADKALIAPNTKQDYVVAGQNHLLETMATETTLPRLQQLFVAFTQKHDILYLLDQCLHTEGVQIFIGEESGKTILDECSMVTASYTVNDQVVGALGVIGPTRMPYQRVISIVDMTAKLLSAALNSGK